MSSFIFILAMLVVWLVFGDENVASVGLLLFAAASIGGMFAIARLRGLYLAKLALVVFFLGSLWAMRLATNDVNFGGDQERAYFDAITLMEYDFDPFALPGINYGGVLYYYAGLFSVFGVSPYVAPIVNTFLTLLAAVLLIRVGAKITGRYDWRFGLWMVIPEILLHDTMTSRDSIATGLVAISILCVTDYVLGRPKRESSVWLALLSIPALMVLAAVRTSAMIPAVLSIALTLWVFRQNLSRTAFFFVSSLAGCVLVAGPVLAMTFGASDEFGLGDLLGAAATANADLLESSAYTWSDNSIGQMLVPDGPFEAVLFTFPRMVLYLIAPWPNVPLSLGDLFAGDWMQWQLLFIATSSLLYIALFPRCIAGLAEAIRGRKEALALHIPFWITMFAAAGGTQFIHERYRLMAVPFMWGCISLGAKRDNVNTARVWWIALLCIGAVGYLIYK